MAWIDKLRHIKKIKGVFNNFMLKSILMLWEYLNVDEYMNHELEVKAIEVKMEGQNK